MRRENQLNDKFFMVLREIKTDDPDGATLQVPDSFGAILSEVSDGWFFIGAIRYPEFQFTHYRVIKIDELRNARFYYMQEHLTRDFRKINEANEQSGLMPKTEIDV